MVFWVHLHVVSRRRVIERENGVCVVGIKGIMAVRDIYGTKVELS